MDTTSRTNFAEASRPVDGSGDQRRAELLLVVVALIWALNYPATKWALGTVNEFVFNTIRFPLAAGLVAVLFPFLAKWQPVRPGDWKRLIGVGLVTNVMYQTAFIVGLSLTTAGNSSIIFSTCPLWTALWSLLLHKENIRRSMWAGMAISVVGVGLIICGSGQQIRFGGHGIWGDLLTVAASVIWALNTNVQKPMVAVYSPMQVNVIALGVGAVVLPLFAIPSMLSMDWATLKWTHYAVAAASGILSIGLSYVLWSYAVKKIGPSRTGAYGNLVPVIVFAASYFVLKEPYTPLQLVGAVVTLCGIWLARR